MTFQMEDKLNLIRLVLTHISVTSPSSLTFSRMYQTVKLLYCFGIFITFALQFYVPVEILIPPVIARVSDRWQKPVDLLLRAVLVIFTCKYKLILKWWDGLGRTTIHQARLFSTGIERDCYSV